MVSVSNKHLSVNSQIAHNKYINCMDFAFNGNMVATGDIDGAVKIFDMSKKEMLGKPHNNHGRGVKAVKFSRDSRHFLSGSEDLHMHLVDIETCQRSLTLVNHADWITSLSFNPSDPKCFISSSLDKTIKIWSSTHGKQVKSIEMGSSVWSAQFSQDGRFIVAACQNGTISLIEYI